MKKLAIIVPYRNRETHLLEFKNFFSTYKIENTIFDIYIIEQFGDDPFNRGKLFNVGFDIVNHNYDYVCFHDVDLIPENNISYEYSETPTHLSKFVEQFNYRIPYENIFGGVVLFNIEDFKKINGFCNSYWGWGAEDDDLRERCIENNLIISRREGRYNSLFHEKNFGGDNHIINIGTLQKRHEYKKDGLLNLKYEVKENTSYLINNIPIFHIKVDIFYNERFNTIKEPSFIFYTTSMGTDVQKVSRDCIRKFYPNNKHIFINGSYENLYPRTWYNWLELAKIDEPDYAIHLDEDCFVVDPNVINEMIAKMQRENIDIMGCRDGGNIMRRQNPYAINPFFMIISKKVYQLFEFFNKEKLFSESLIYEGETLPYFEYDYKIDYTNNFEPYYDFFWYARSNKFKFEFLDYFEEPELNCSFLYNHIIHAWYLRTRNYEQKFDRMNYTNKERYDLILQKIKQKLNG